MIGEEETMTKSSALHLACTQAMIELYGDTSALEALPAPVISPAFERKMKRLTAHVRNNRYHRLTRGAKVLLVAAVLLLLASITVVAARQFGFTLLDFGDHSELDMEQHTAVNDGNLVCGYIPEGFVLTDEAQTRSDVYRLFCKTKNEYFEVIKYFSYSTFGVDTEFKEPKEIEHNGITYTVVSTEDSPDVLWIDSATNCLYEVSGNISEEELLKIAYHTK